MRIYDINDVYAKLQTWADSFESKFGRELTLKEQLETAKARLRTVELESLKNELLAFDPTALRLTIEELEKRISKQEAMQSQPDNSMYLPETKTKHNEKAKASN